MKTAPQPPASEFKAFRPSPPAVANRRGFPAIALVLLATLYTGLNSLKPLQVDDAAYYYFAAHIARHPLDPYGFEIYWYQWPNPANHVLAPPVLLYWWAAGLRLFGQHPVLWKLWLFPIGLLFVGSLYALARRFARGLEMPLVTMTVLGPAFLPSLNLMLDIPALALGLIALTLFFRACDRRCWRWALAAGGAAGLAMQTKYTAFLAPAAMGLYAGVLTLFACRLQKDWWKPLAFALVAGLTALALFVGWELFVLWRHGESHFYHEFKDSRRDWADQLRFFGMPLLALLGGVAPTLALLGLVALRRRAWWVGLASLLILGGFGLVAGCEKTFSLPAVPGLTDIVYPGVTTLGMDQIVFTTLGLAVIFTWIVLTWRPVGQAVVRRAPLTYWRGHRLDWFLVLWLSLEVAGYFALTPFAAVRRVLGVVVVATLFVGRRAARAGRARERVRLAWGVAGATALLGLLFFVVDDRDARASQEAAAGAAAAIRERDPGGTIWYVGHWGFQFYAERAGMRPLVPDRSDRPLHRGDWLVVPSPNLEQQQVRTDTDNLELIDEIAVGDDVSLRTVRCFYGTSTGVPLEHQDGPRVSVKIYRVKRDFMPVTPG